MTKPALLLQLESKGYKVFENKWDLNLIGFLKKKGTPKDITDGSMS